MPGAAPNAAAASAAAAPGELGGNERCGPADSMSSFMGPLANIGQSSHRRSARPIRAECFKKYAPRAQIVLKSGIGRTSSEPNSNISFNVALRTYNLYAQRRRRTRGSATRAKPPYTGTSLPLHWLGR